MFLYVKGFPSHHKNIVLFVKDINSFSPGSNHLAHNNINNRDSIIKAIAEFNHLGEMDVHKTYGFKKSITYNLIHEKKRYPPKAIFGIAYQYEYGAPLTRDEFQSTIIIRDNLKNLGFDIVGKEDKYPNITMPKLKSFFKNVMNLPEDTLKKLKLWLEILSGIGKVMVYLIIVILIVGSGWAITEIGTGGITATRPTAKPSEFSEIIPMLEVSPSSQPLGMGAQSFVIKGSDGDGYEWCSSQGGTYTISYVSGAYSAWANDKYCADLGCWETAIRGYLDRPINWVKSGSQNIPTSPDFTIGWHLPGSTTIKDAESLARDSSSVFIELLADSCITFIAIGGNLSYLDNRGEVEIMAKRDTE